ncbi:MAG: bifunctional riboflavin kinase/FMN adenylyltransferase [Planctomycetota bacterium]
MPAEARGGAVTIGNFDGVHRGHATIVAKLRERAAEAGGPSVVFTFDPHPVRLLRPEECPPPLTWTERKAELLAALGVDLMIAYPTDEALLRLSAREFFDQIVRGLLDARAMVEGPNFYFGRNREGTIDLLGEFAGDAGMSLDIVQPLRAAAHGLKAAAVAPDADAEGLVSSSRIRKLIQSAGDVGLARQMLTAPYRLRGIVTHGAGRGAKIGFPTANLEGIDTLLPAHGVYSGLATIDRVRRPAAIHIGPNPTFGEGATKVEVHVIGQHDPLYGKAIEIDFLDRLRGVEQFADKDALVEQLRSDVARAEAAGSDYLQQAR